MITSYLAIIAITCIISFIGFQNANFTDRNLFQIARIRSGEYFRLLSSGFLHGDLFHLAFNMISFYSFAQFLDYYYSEWQMYLLYFGSMFLGSLFTLQIHKNEPHYAALGASGAVSGIIFAAILLEPTLELRVFFAIPLPGYLFAVLYLAYSIYGMKAQNDGIGHTAHFGGAFGGILIAILLQPSLLINRIGLVLFFILVLAVLYLLVKKRLK
jgi:membrane associated rhomboid family serine protease